jgi:3-hydroxyacyl-CoA dehydrogenase/enoyl-CoA hydratase/3-hydroxybutyryl-CoA epimerase
LRSGKSLGFSPGYDLVQFASLETSAQRSAFAARGQQFTQKLANLSPSTLTIAVIEGECRSAGLELALACDYRVGVARTGTFFEFADLRRGLTPCWGGTLRLPRLIGLSRAIAMLIDGRELSAREALAWGLVDQVYEERRARIELQAFLDRLQDRPRRLAVPRCFSRRLRDGVGVSRWAALKHAEHELADVDPIDRPAAFMALRSLRLAYISDADALAAERSAAGELGDSADCRNALARERRAAQPLKVFPEPFNPVPSAPERIGIVGGGELGAALARWFAMLGRHVVVQEANEDALVRASERIEREFREVTARGILTASEADQAKKNVRRTASWNGFEDAALVVEAVDEDLGIKRSVLHDLEQRVRPRVILASASTTIRIEALQAELQRPNRVAGLHFVDAAIRNQMVEIVCAPATDPGTLAALGSWLRTWGKAPLLVSDRPGRVIARMQLAYLSEAVILVAEGLPPELVDREMRRFGMRHGPLEAIDAFGFDRLARLVDNLQLARGDGFARNLLLERMRSFGWNGRENGEGFYRYRAGREHGRENHLARVVMWRDTDDDVIVARYR